MEEPKWKAEYKKDTVYLHVLPRSVAGAVVNVSPFAIKVELWLRVTGIPYQTVDYMGWSFKGKSPFIMFNGEEIPDSNFIVGFLSDYFKKDLFPGYSPSERAVGRAFIKTLEENTVWSIFIYRYVEHNDEFANYFMVKAPMELRLTQLNAIGDPLAKRAQGHGIGCHTSEEIHKIGCDDIQAVSDFLGDKQYMLGAIPSLLDCVVFGVLSQVVYVPMGYPQRKYILDKCPNIMKLMEKLKTTYWQNWDEECQL